MGCKELIDSLRQAADEKRTELRQQAEGEVQALRREYSQRTEEARRQQDAHLAAKTRESAVEILSDARGEALLIKLSSEKLMADRLFRIALGALETLRDDRYEGLFSALAGELPPLRWRTVRVNPGDVALAGRHFPGASIVEDPAISGGMEVMTEDGKIRTINTFEKRLERAWERIVPLLMKKLYEREDRHGTA